MKLVNTLENGLIASATLFGELYSVIRRTNSHSKFFIETEWSNFLSVNIPHFIRTRTKGI